METHDDVDQFQCIICLELVYKPIVHACGHLFCFWCVHKAMDGAYKNLCPLCRRPYMHFPRICEQLHFVLLKAVRDKYLVRAKEVQEEEAQGGIFSPEIHAQPPRIMPLDIMMEEASSTSTETVSSESACLSTSSSSSSDEPNPREIVSFKGKAPMPEEGEPALPAQELPGKTDDVSSPVTTLDLACLHCGNLLYRPVVLNCGHMFCEHCVAVGVGDGDDTVSCPSCKAEHPGMFPQVCLEMHHYIDRVFPLEYAQRSLQVTAEERDRPPNRPQLPPPPEPQESLLKSRIRRSLRIPGPVHRAVGCDGCGMMPIVGKRFQCQDCPDAIGFDLCQKCHDSGCVVGRFNQRHTAEHRMVEVLLNRGIARQFLDAMANHSLNLMDVRHDCNESEALQVLLMQQRINGGSNGLDPHAAPSAAEEVTDGGDHQDGDGHHEAFMHSHGEDGEFDDHDDESEFEAFSRDDKDIDFFRVVFHS